MTRITATLATFVVLFSSCPTLWAQDAPSEETLDFFKRNCSSCHTIGGGRLAGPDLKNVQDRRDRAWLTAFIPDPKKVIDSGDPYARKLLEEARGVVMPTLPGIDAALAGKLVAMIAAESKLEKSHFMGLTISDRPLNATDIVTGEALFTGRAAFKSGAPPCNSCHTTAPLGGLGGGALGPDLTAAYARLEGRKAIAAWLSAPPSPVMGPVFRTHPLEGEEILGVVAYLKNAAETSTAAQGTSRVDFLLVSAGCAALLLMVADFLWRRRFRAVRRPMVSRS